MKSCVFKYMLILFVCLIFVGCTRQEPKKELVIWTDMTEEASLKGACAKFTEETGYPVRIVRVPFEELPSKFQVAGPVRKGPDLITGPHDWVGTFATAKLIAPVDMTYDEKSNFLQVPLKTLSFKNELYGLPISVETLGLIYNKKYIKKAPDTFDDLLTIAELSQNGKIDELKAMGKYNDVVNFDALSKNKVTGFLFEAEDFYFSWAFMAGYGAYIFKETPEGLDPYQNGLASKEAVEAAYFLESLTDKYKLIPQGMTKDIANGRFMEDNLLFTINGPWALVDYKKQNIDFGFAPIPKLSTGRYPAPFVGVQGVYLNAKTPNRDLAIKLMKQICSKDTEVSIYLEGGRIPSRFDAQRDERIKALGEAANDELRSVLRAVDLGTPMPNIPQMRTVWQPMKEALQLILRPAGNDKKPEEALPMASERIKGDVERMMQ